MNQGGDKPPDTWMFHESEAPKGRLVHADQVFRLKRKGWVDSPAKFGKSLRSRFKRTVLAVRTFWRIVFPKD
jgi:hypothetical protein